MKNCPSCQSDQFKKATLVYAEGAPGAKKSAIAETCAPPKLKEPSPFSNTPMWQVLVAVIPPMLAQAMASMNAFWMVWGGLGVVYLVSKAWKPFKEYQSRKAKAQVEYEKCFMCLRCGTLSHPFD